jgi:hypothetical protein
LEGSEAAELDAHIIECSACHHYAQDLERLDTHLGTAMRAVAVPHGLKEQIMQRLAADQASLHRRWAARVMRGVLAAAAGVLIVWGVWNWLTPSRPTIAAEEVVHDYNHVRPYQEATDAQLKNFGFRRAAPNFVNYAFLIGEPSIAILPGTEGWKKPVQVPQLVFADQNQRAVVYAVPRGKYNVELDSVAPGYTYTLDHTEKGEYTYLILHTGKDCNWLRVTPDE